MGKHVIKMGKKFMKKAWLFPGQGSQKVGMGKDLYKKTNLGKKYFQLANEIMEYDIKSIIFDGPKESLKKTEHTQPAIYIISVLLGKLLLDKGFEPDVVAGHSLGEYSALAISNAFNFETGLELVKIRSESMANASTLNKGTMAAIIGLEEKKIESICSTYNGIGVVTIANYNSPNQIVISGSTKAIQDTMQCAKDAGAKIAVELKVSGAFHSPLMKPAREALAHKLNSLEIHDITYPLYTNVDAKPITKGENIKNSLLRQLENPVLWTKLILRMKKDSVSHFTEVGQGKVLQGLNKRIDKSFNSNGIESLSQMESIFV